MAERINCGLAARDTNDRLVFVNERIAKWTGYTVEELQDTPAEDLVAPELRELVARERVSIFEVRGRARQR